MSRLEELLNPIALYSEEVMKAQGGVTAELCRWLCSVKADDLPPEVRRKTLDVLLDSVGGMIVCTGMPEVTRIVDFLIESGGKPECTIIGQREQTSAVNAAMANGAMAHGDEVDPVHLSSAGGHVAAGIVPTALTVGEYLNASGKEVLLATALGYEVGARLMTIFYRERDYLTRRFYHTAVAGTVSSAVTAGLLLGLDRQSLQVAMGLAAYQAAGPDNMTTDPGHMGKTFQVGAANRNGVTAAFLARKGCFVPLDILEGACGLFDAFVGTREVAPEMLTKIGEYYAITDVMHKRYPVGSPNQTYLQGLFNLLQEHEIRAEDIQNIEIQIPTRGVRRIPTTRHASIAGEMVCAIAVVRGKLDAYELHDPSTAADPSVQKMRRLISFIGRDDWKTLEHGRHAIVTIKTEGGQTHKKEIWLQPMSRQEINEKFKALVAPRMGHEKTYRLETALNQLDNAASVRPLLRELSHL